MSESESIDTVNQPLARATLDAIRARWQRDEADLDSKTEHLLKAAEDLTCDKDDYCILPKGHEGAARPGKGTRRESRRPFWTDPAGVPSSFQPVFFSAALLWVKELLRSDSALVWAHTREYGLIL